MKPLLFSKWMAKIYLSVNKIVKQKFLVKQDKNDKNAYRIFCGAIWSIPANENVHNTNFEYYRN